MNKNHRQLILCPEDPDWVSASIEIDNSEIGNSEIDNREINNSESHDQKLNVEAQINLQHILRSVGLIADQVVTTKVGRFYIGEQFLQHINFMGCAPAVEFEPKIKNEPDWLQFTFVHIPSELGKPGWFADLSLAKPQCPDCNKRSALPDKQISNYFDEHKNHYCCPHCQQQSKVCDVNWREFGGCARTLISLVNVYPKEALPTENLLVKLEEQTQTAWRYFYYFGPLINVNT